MSSIARIVAELITVIGMSMNSPAMVVSDPVIRQLDPADLQRRVCGKPCRVLAWYGPDGVIYIDNRVDPQRNIVAKGILLHELVHHVQREARGGNSRNCVEWLQRERQAYRIQAQWLFDNGIDASPLIWQVRTVRCNPDAFGKRSATETK
ncbi:MAG: hypothetical protein HKP56_09760 [Anderseniella sp.]|nr:hypothetical protein [Anderseniella sp.]